jgi:hypothetical protein
LSVNKNKKINPKNKKFSKLKPKKKNEKINEKKRAVKGARTLDH